MDHKALDAFFGVFTDAETQQPDSVAYAFAAWEEATETGKIPIHFNWGKSMTPDIDAALAKVGCTMADLDFEL